MEQYINLMLFNLAQTQTKGGSMNPFMLILLAVFFIISALLVTTILSQTTKSEGLSGTIGGRTESVFKGKSGPKSLEDKLEQITTFLAVGFLVLATILSVVGF